MKKITVYYYTSPKGENPVKKFLDSLSKNQQAKILRVFQYLEEYGLQTTLPHIKKLTGTPMFEIRILGRDNLRTLYVIPQKDFILVLHGFVKKTQKTPRGEIETALNRYKEWLSR